jgi:predicted nucleic acid-binding protein
MPTAADRWADQAHAVMDPSALVAMLTDLDGGRWVAEQVSGRSLIGPHLLPFETGNVLRRLEAAGEIDPTTAAMAHADLLDLALGLVGYPVVADRARELRANLTTYDASYVALAEALDAPLVTLDARIAAAPGIRCTVVTPPLTPVSGRSPRKGSSRGA